MKEKRGNDSKISTTRFLRYRQFALANSLSVRFLMKTNMKKYLLLIENEELWEKFKKTIDKDINTEIISLIEKKIKKEGKNDK